MKFANPHHSLAQPDTRKVVKSTTISTQKIPFSWIDTNSPEWRAIVDYVLGHEDDINDDINDFGTLKPVLDHLNRNV